MTSRWNLLTRLASLLWCSLSHWLYVKPQSLPPTKCMPWWNVHFLLPFPFLEFKVDKIHSYYHKKFLFLCLASILKLNRTLAKKHTALMVLDINYTRLLIHRHKIEIQAGKITSFFFSSHGWHVHKRYSILCNIINFILY